MPRFLESQVVTAISHLRANASWDGWSPGEDIQVAIYSPPPGWVVLETQTIIHSSNNGSRSISTLAGGLNLVTETIIDSVYKDAIDASGKYKDKSIEGNLKAERDSRKKEVINFQSNKNVIQAKAQAKAHGSFADRKRGWEELSVNAKIIYIGEPSQDALVQEIERAYGITVYSFTAEMFADKNLVSASSKELLDTEKRSQENIEMKFEKI